MDLTSRTRYHIRAREEDQQQQIYQLLTSEIGSKTVVVVLEQIVKKFGHVVRGLIGYVRHFCPSTVLDAVRLCNPEDMGKNNIRYVGFLLCLWDIQYVQSELMGRWHKHATVLQ